jgi:hypothetical protein
MNRVHVIIDILKRKGPKLNFCGIPHFTIYNNERVSEM